MRWAAWLALLIAGPAHADDDDDYDGGMVLFARDGALWETDPDGEGPAIELARLPDGAAASDVRMIRTDPAGRTVILDVAGAWWWLRPDEATVALAKLDCADAPARLTADGSCVVCADEDGQVMMIGLDTGKVARKPVPAAGARVVETEGTRELIWADADGVWAAPVTQVRKASARRELAPEPPLRGFLPAPDGSRAVGVYMGEVYQKRKEKVPAEVFGSFALDGKAARRQLFRDAEVIDWSWDSEWVLVQEQEKACVARATGGQYKCWKKYTAVSLSPDGKWALLLGKRKKGEDGERSLYRARLEGQYTEKPSLVETVIDGGGALWLPSATAGSP
jgi:hypothetical protein